MAVRPLDAGRTTYEEAASRKREAALSRDVEADEENDLSDSQRAELDIAKYCLNLFREAERARDPYETFDDAWDAFNGNLWPAKYPVWKARITLNKIRAFVWFMQAVMTDQKPRVTVEPLAEGSEPAAKILQRLVDRDWSENDVQHYIALAVLYGLIFGTGFLKITYDPSANGSRGAHVWDAPVPYRIYTNPTATGVEDADYLIHVEDRSLGWIAQHYPDDYERVRKFKGSRVSSTQDVGRDLIREGSGEQRLPIENAVRTAVNNIMQDLGRPSRNMDDQDVVEVAEFWIRDWSREEYRRQKMVHGVPMMKDVIGPNGLPAMEQYGTLPMLSPIDGLPFAMPLLRTKREPVMETAKRFKYPNGRLVIMAGPCVLVDIPNPFQIDGFPFASWKNQDVGAFWGTGEPINLKDPQVAMQRMVSQVYDILEKTGNPSYKYKKGSGLETRSLKNKPGSIIPLDEMDALAPLETKPVQPAHLETVQFLKGIMPELIGLQDAFMGGQLGGNTSFATVDALQESGAAPVRARVRSMESMIQRAGTLRIQLIQQFDNGERALRERVPTPWPAEMHGEDGEIVAPPPAAASEVQFTKYTRAELQGPVEFGVVPDSSLSISPSGLKNFYMTLFDKHLVDQQAVLEKLKVDDAPAIIKRMREAQMLAAAAKGKPGPKPKNANRDARPRSPGRNVPTRHDNAAMR